MERHASHTVTLRGGSSKACSHGERRGDALRGVERIAVEKTGMASHTALFRERGSEVGNATNRMGPEAFAWARNRSGKDGFFTLRIFRCAAEAARSGMDCLGETCRGKLRRCMEWIGLETSLSFGREAFGADWRRDDRLSQDRRANITRGDTGSFRGSEWRGTASSAQARIAPATSRA